MAIKLLDPTLAEKGARLTKLRVIADVTQEVLAHEVGYSGRKAASNISRIENGERDLPNGKAQAAARYLASTFDLVDDWEYLLGYLQLEHVDLRGCIAAHRRLRPAGEAGALGSAAEKERKGGYLREAA